MNLSKHTILLFTLFLSFSCASQKDYTISQNAFVVSKYLVLDEKLSPQITNCARAIPDFKDFDNDCSFLLDKMEFDVQEKYNVDTYGKLKEYLRYKSEGALFYTLEDLKTDTIYYNSLGLKNFNLAFSEDKKYIIDSSDTLEIERIFPNEKLIFTKRTSKQIEDKRRVIYQYE